MKGESEVRCLYYILHLDDVDAARVQDSIEDRKELWVTTGQYRSGLRAHADAPDEREELGEEESALAESREPIADLLWLLEEAERVATSENCVGTPLSSDSAP